jgi:hypothetical protein
MGVATNPRQQLPALTDRWQAATNPTQPAVLPGGKSPGRMGPDGKLVPIVNEIDLAVSDKSRKR